MPRNTGTLLAISVVVTALLGACGGDEKTYVVPSEAMAPTFHKSDRAVVELDAYDAADPARGDIVVFVGPDSWGAVAGGKVIKRVIAIEGDTVQCCDPGNRVILNGSPLVEPYRGNAVAQQSEFGSVTVPKGRLWVMGDNRPNSADSRMHYSDLDHGTVGVDAVLGQVRDTDASP